MNLVYNEQVKLLAVTFNNLGIATIVTGAVAPISSYVYGVYQSVPLPTIMALTSVWITSGTLLIISARIVLRGLKE